jgi:hypothetical protein
VILKGKNGGKFAKLFHGLSFGMTFFSRVKVLGFRVLVVYLMNSPFQPLGLGLGLNVNVSLSAPKLGVRLQIDKRLWTNGKLQLIRDCGLMENSKS